MNGMVVVVRVGAFVMLLATSLAAHATAAEEGEKGPAGSGADDALLAELDGALERLKVGLEQAPRDSQVDTAALAAAVGLVDEAREVLQPPKPAKAKTTKRAKVKKAQGWGPQDVSVIQAFASVVRALAAHPRLTLSPCPGGAGQENGLVALGATGETRRIEVRSEPVSSIVALIPGRRFTKLRGVQIARPASGKDGSRRLVAVGLRLQ